MQLSEGTAESIYEGARQSGLDYSWACRLVKRYNQLGAESLKDGRSKNKRRELLGEEDKRALLEVMQAEPSDGGLWNGPKVGRWMEERLGRSVRSGVVWRIMRGLGLRGKVPRPAHEKAASQEERAAYKKSSGKTLRGSKGRTPRGKSSFGPKTKHG